MASGEAARIISAAEAQNMQRDLTRMPMVPDYNSGALVPSMLVRMRCEECEHDHRMLIGVNTPLHLLPEMTKSTFRCDCPSHIPTIKTMDRSLMSINGVPFRDLQAFKKEPDANRD